MPNSAGRPNNWTIGSKKFEIIFTIPISSRILIIKINGINILYKGMQISLIFNLMKLKTLGFNFEVAGITLRLLIKSWTNSLWNYSFGSSAFLII